MKRSLQLLLAGFILCYLPSCKFMYPNTMFKQKDYQYIELAQKQIEQYLIQPGDELTVKVYSRDGFKLVDVIGSPSEVVGEVISSYLVDREGFVKLPVIGYIFVSGYSESELERLLAEKYAGLFVDPYIVAKVVNRRVFVFKGNFAKIVQLDNSPTSIFEVLASAGGLDQTLKAYRIKLIRGDLQNPQVQMIDLSTLEGIRKSNVTVQGNDIIYVESKHTPKEILGNITPYISLVSTIATLIILGRTLGN